MEKQLHLIIRDLIVTYLCESYISVDRLVEPGTFCLSASNLDFQLMEEANWVVLVSNQKFRQQGVLISDCY